MPAVGKVAQEEVAYPLEMVRCHDCGLCQIGVNVDPEVLFPYTYPYLSGTTRILRDNFADLQREATSLYPITKEDLIIDVGSNDGSLLQPFQAAGHRVLGIEPSMAGEVARSRGIETLTAYFSRETAAKVRAGHGQSRLITAANVFAHMTKLHDIVDGILDLLAEDGLFVNESHYLLDLLQTNQYDTIYHEHLRYYHLAALSTLFSQHGLEIVHACRIPTHGGSIRVYAARIGRYPVASSVASLLAEEAKAGLIDGSAFATFRRRITRSKVNLYTLISGIKNQRGRIYGIGAPSRASTLINYVGLDDGIIDCVLEVKGSHKIGKYVPGTRIPVEEEGRLFTDPPDCALLLSWHIADELMPILRRKGFAGKFLVPLPSPVLIEPS